ncbi:MAG: hypothetical protein ACK4YU_01010 [Paracoccus sp. (in: a-proteobacteria)]
MKTAIMLTVLALAACTAAAPDRPMDEVPVQQVRPNGEREYRFANGCAIVLAPDRAVLRSESGVCELYQRDIALLYASAD